MLNSTELNQYSRQLSMLGEEAQEKLQRATVFIAGAGGLAAAIAGYLAAAGTGCIRIADPDTIQISNLNRQVFYANCDLGNAKVTILQARLVSLNPHIRIQAFPERLEDANADVLVGDASLLIDALDNFPSRHVLNRTALRRRLPLIHGAVREFYGQVTTIVPYDTVCLACIWGNTPAAEDPQILGSTCGVIGSIQATEAIKILTGTGETLRDRLYIWDGLRAESSVLQLRPNPVCPECGGNSDPSDRESIR
jgi:molybdopterin-synthase adenylyltransferase